MEPMYYRVKKSIEDKIASKEFAVGEFLPNEADLGSYYNASRTTIRKAISMLVQDGKLIIIRGKGTKVAPTTLNHNVDELMSFTDLMKKQGMSPSLINHTVELMYPDAHTAQMLGISEEEKVYFIHRVRYADTDPISINSSYIKADYIRGFDSSLIEKEQSLYGVLKEYFNTEIFDTEDSVMAVPATKEQADILKVKKGSPLLYIERIAHDKKNQLIEYSKIYIRSDRYKHIIRLRKNS